LRSFQSDDEQKKQLRKGQWVVLASGAIRALSLTKVFLIAADAAAKLCKEFLAGRLEKENFSVCGGGKPIADWSSILQRKTTWCRTWLV
jgi:hypothetical protein